MIDGLKDKAATGLLAGVQSLISKANKAAGDTLVEFDKYATDETAKSVRDSNPSV